MYNFKFADIGEGIHEGKLLEWLVNVGDKIDNGESLFLVETDKVNAEIPSPVSGTIISLNANVNDTIYVGDVIVVIDDGVANQDESPIPTEEAEEKGAGVVGEITVSNDLIPSFHHEEQTSNSSTRKVLATPVARKMAKDFSIDINEVVGTGIQGRVMKDDIKKFYQSKNKVEEAKIIENIIPETTSVAINRNFGGVIEEVEISSTRKAIARAMTFSKQTIPHAVMMDDFDVTELINFRRDAKESAQTKGIKLTYLTFIMKALSIALKEFPVFNSTYDEANGKIIYKKYYNLGIATDTEKGLMVPVIKGVSNMSILDIAAKITELVDQCRNGSVSLSDLSDGTFSITNYGAIGTLFGTPIIRHPEVAILGIGKIIRKPVFAENGELLPRHIMPISLAIDHRVIDGADAGRFSNRLKELLSDPKLLIMS